MMIADFNTCLLCPLISRQQDGFDIGRAQNHKDYCFAMAITIFSLASLIEILKSRINNLII
jgi:hypothetical protein